MSFKYSNKQESPKRGRIDYPPHHILEEEEIPSDIYKQPKGTASYKREYDRGYSNKKEYGAETYVRYDENRPNWEKKGGLAQSLDPSKFFRPSSSLIQPQHSSGVFNSRISTQKPHLESQLKYSPSNRYGQSETMDAPENGQPENGLATEEKEKPPQNDKKKHIKVIFDKTKEFFEDPFLSIPTKQVENSQDEFTNSKANDFRTKKSMLISKIQNTRETQYQNTETGTIKQKKDLSIKSACLFPDKKKVIACVNSEFGCLLSFSIADNPITPKCHLIPELRKPPTTNTVILAIDINNCGDSLLFGGNRGKAGILKIVEPTESESDITLKYDKNLIFNSDLIIRAVKFSKDDEDALIGTDDGYLKIYRIQEEESYQDLEKVPLHQGGLCSIAICPSSNNDWIATGGKDNKIKITKIHKYEKGNRELKILKVISTHTGIVRSLAFSFDGELLLSGSYDTTAKLFDTSTWEPIATFSGHTKEVFSVAISPDKKFILTGSKDNSLLYDRETREILATYTDKKGENTENDEQKTAFCVALFVGDGSIIMTSGEHGVLNFYSYALNQNYRKHSKHGNDNNKNKRIRAIDVWDNMILTGGEDSTVRLYDKETGFEIRRFEGHGGPIYCVAFSKNGAAVSTGGYDCILRIFDVSTGSLLKSFNNHTEYISVLIYSPSGKEIITGGADQALFVYDSYKGDQPLFRFPSKMGKIDCIAVFSPDTNTVVIFTGGKIKKEYPGSDNNKAVLNVDYNPKVYPTEEPISVELEGTSVFDIKLVNGENGEKYLAAITGTYPFLNNLISLYNVENLQKNIKRPLLNIHLMQNIDQNMQNSKEDIPTNPIRIEFYNDSWDYFVTLSEKRINGRKLYSLDKWEIVKNNTNEAEFPISFNNIYEYKANRIEETLENDDVDDGALKIIKNEVIFGTKEGIPDFLYFEKYPKHPFSGFSSEVAALCITNVNNDGIAMESPSGVLPSPNLAVTYKSHEIRILDAYTGRLKSIFPSLLEKKIKFTRFYNQDDLLVIAESEKLGILVKIFKCSEAGEKVPPGQNDVNAWKEYDISSITAVEVVEVVEVVEEKKKVNVKKNFAFFGTKKGEIYYSNISTAGDGKNLPKSVYIPLKEKVLPIIALCHIFEEQAGFRLFACSQNGKLREYSHLSTEDDPLKEIKINREKILSKHEQNLVCAAFNPAKTHLITGGKDCCVRIIELVTLKENIFEGHSREVIAVGFFHETSHAYSASEDNVLKVFEVESGTVIYEFENKNKITSICTSPTYDTIFVGTDSGISILERVINTPEKLLYFYNTMKKIDPNIGDNEVIGNNDFMYSNYLETHDLKNEDINIAPFPINLSLLNILTMLSDDPFKIIKSTLNIISEFSDGRQIILRSIFRRDEKFGFAPWDWWCQLGDHKKKYLYLVDIATSKGITGLETMQNKQAFIREVASHQPGKLHKLLDSFWGELESLTVQIYELEVKNYLQSFWDFILFKLSRLSSCFFWLIHHYCPCCCSCQAYIDWCKKIILSYRANKSNEFPLYLMGKTSSPSDNYFENRYNNMFNIEQNENKNKKRKIITISTKVGVSRIMLDELFHCELKNGDNKKITLKNNFLPILEDFDSEHSVFRSELLACLVTNLLANRFLDGLDGDIIVDIIWLLEIAVVTLSFLNIIFFIPQREFYRLPDKEKLILGIDLSIIIILAIIFLFRVYSLLKYSTERDSNESDAGSQKIPENNQNQSGKAQEHLTQTNKNSGIQGTQKPLENPENNQNQPGKVQEQPTQTNKNSGLQGTQKRLENPGNNQNLSGKAQGESAQAKENSPDQDNQDPQGLSISRSSVLWVVNSCLGIFACTLDLFWANGSMDQYSWLIFITKCSLGIFMFLSWFSFTIKFSKKNLTKATSLAWLLYGVTKDTVPFLIILAFLFLGFAFSVSILQSSYSSNWLEVLTFMKNLYFVMIGDYENFNDFDTQLDKTLFFIILVIFTVFFVIVMLNFLIAIISASYENVSSREEQNKLHDKIRKINRKIALLTNNEKKDLYEAIKGQFIFKLDKVIDEEDDKSLAERSQNSINDIRDITDEIKRENSKRFKAVEGKLQNIEKVLSQLVPKFQDKSDII